MPSLDDLKKNASNPETAETTGGFVPELKLESPDSTSIPTIVQLSSGEKTVPGRKTRVKADLSSLPKRPEYKPESPVQVRESLVKDILGPGGEFEQYVEEQKEEFYDRMAEEELNASERASKSVAEGETVEDNDFDEFFGDIEPPVDAPIKTIDVLSEERTEVEDDSSAIDDLFADDFETEDDVNIEETIEEEVVEEEPVYVQSEPEEEEVIESTLPEPEIIMTKADEDDYEDLDAEEEVEDIEDDDDDVDSDERLLLLKKLITEKIHPVKKKLDLSTYTISKKINTSNNVIATKEVPAAKWVLASSQSLVMMKDFGGSELEAIREARERRAGGTNRPDYRTIFNSIYNHIVSPKPDTFEKWLKVTSYFDYDHLFFAMYIASFHGANYIPIECTNPKCNNKIKTYLTENVPIMDMIKFTNKEAEEKFKQIYNSASYQPKDLKMSEIVPISDTIAIGFTMPSLHSVYMESEFYDAQFNRKYARTIDIMPYIDNIYIIHNDTKELEKVAYKIYTNNLSKSTKARVQRYDSILKRLTSDEYTLIGAIINSINTEKENIMMTYHLPETTCPNCGHVNEQSEAQSPEELVFTRNRLGLLAII